MTKAIYKILSVVILSAFSFVNASIWFHHHEPPGSCCETSCSVAYETGNGIDNPGNTETETCSFCKLLTSSVNIFKSVSESEIFLLFDKTEFPVYSKLFYKVFLINQSGRSPPAIA